MSNVPLHPADLGTDNFDQEFTFGLMQNQEEVLSEIADALERIRLGSFGKCERYCAATIPKGRLNALPYAPPVIVSRVPNSFNTAFDGFFMPQRSYRVVLWTLALLGVSLDQATKYGVFNWLASPESHSYQLFGSPDQGFQLVAQYKEGALTANAGAARQSGSTVRPGERLCDAGQRRLRRD